MQVLSGKNACVTRQQSLFWIPNTKSPQPHLHSVSKLLIESHTLPTQVYRGSFLLWDPKNDAHFGKTSIFDDKCVLLVKLVHWKIKSSKNKISDLKIKMSNTNTSFPAKLDLSIFVREFVRDVNPKQSSILHSNLWEHRLESCSDTHCLEPEVYTGDISAPTIWLECGRGNRTWQEVCW